MTEGKSYSDLMNKLNELREAAKSLRTKSNKALIDIQELHHAIKNVTDALKESERNVGVYHPSGGDYPIK